MESCRIQIWSRNIAPENAHDYRQLLLSLRCQYFHCSPTVTPYLELETANAWIRPSKEQQIARREHQHNTQTISDCPIHQAKKEIRWGTFFAKILIAFFPLWQTSTFIQKWKCLFFFSFYFYLSWQSRYLRRKNNFFKTCRDVCEPSPSGRQGVKHKSSQLPGQQLYCRDATLEE